MLIQAGLKCTSCTSSDAMAQYDNGTYCFSCHHRTSTEVRPKYEIEDVKEKKILFTEERSKELVNYLDRYPYLTEYKPVSAITIGKAIYENLIAFPVPGGYQCRNFGNFGSKWVFYIEDKAKFAKKFEYFERSPNKGTVYVVEDLVSYKALSQNGLYGNIYCLFGTHITKEALARLSKTNHHLVIWLDNDAPGNQASNKIAKQASCFFTKISKIGRTSNEPKYYTFNELLTITERMPK